MSTTITTVVDDSLQEALEAGVSSEEIVKTSGTQVAAKLLLLKSFDTALPQDWVDDVRRKTGFYPLRYGFVWCYDVAKTFGEPVPLTMAAFILLRFSERVR